MTTADESMTRLPGPSRPAYDEEMSLVGLANVLLRRWRLVIGVPIAVGVVAILLGLLFRTYVAASSFVPQESTSSMSELLGIAAQVGVSLGQEQQGASPEFYASLVK